MSQVFKFRGIDNCYIAKLIKDDATGIEWDTPIKLFPIGEAGKTTSSESATDYADNKALLIVNSEGADEISLTGFGIALSELALITGKTFNEAKGAFLDTVREPGYFGLMYREKLTNGKYRYVVRYKGSFSIPDEGATTENDGTDSMGQSVTFTGIFTEHHFTNGGSAKGLVIDTQYAGADVSAFFTEGDGYTEIPTADTITAKSA